MESTDFQQQQQHHHHQPQGHYVAYPPPPLPNYPASYGVSSTTHEWNLTIPMNANNYSEDISRVSEARSFAHHSAGSLLQLANIREDAHTPSPFNNFGGINQDPANNIKNSWLISNGFSSSAAQYSSPRELQLPVKYHNSVCQFPGTNSSALNDQLPLTTSSSASSSFPAREYFLSSSAAKFSNGRRWSPFGHGQGKEECVPWGHGDVQQSSGSPLNSSRKAAAYMNGATGTKRPGNYPDQPSKSSSLAGAKKSPLKTSCPLIKVRKEKLGDRIAALHQLVSPFGKTDTASVLTEAIGYIHFLQDQIQTLCMLHVKPLRNKPCREVQMGRSCEDDGMEEAKQDLRRGLCVVPLSWTSFIATEHHQLDPFHSHYFLNSNN
ncbi:hypothetical protein Ancab_003243 [Ancistrocladus abbreviatus]